MFHDTSLYNVSVSVIILTSVRREVYFETDRNREVHFRLLMLDINDDLFITKRDYISSWHSLTGVITRAAFQL